MKTASRITRPSTQIVNALDLKIHVPQNRLAQRTRVTAVQFLRVLVALSLEDCCALYANNRPQLARVSNRSYQEKSVKTIMAVSA